MYLDRHGVCEVKGGILVMCGGQRKHIQPESGATRLKQLIIQS